MSGFVRPFTSSSSVSISGNGADGYVAFYTSANKLAGDNDIYWNRAANRLEIGGGGEKLGSDIPLLLGPDSNSVIKYSSVQTPDSLIVGVGALSNSLIVCENADVNSDFNFPQQANPTLVLQSGSSIDGERLYLSHNQTDGYIATDSGDIVLAPKNGGIIIQNPSTNYTTLPAIRSGSDPNTGIGFAGADYLTLTSGGAAYFELTGSTVYCDVQILMNNNNIIRGNTLPLKLGVSSTTSHSLTFRDVLIGNNLEVDGYSYFDGYVSFLKPQSKTVINVNTASYYMTGEHEVILVSTAVGTTVHLPKASTVANAVFIIKDRTGNASGNNIIVKTAQGGELIDGSSSATISTNYGKLYIISDGNNWLSL